MSDVRSLWEEFPSIGAGWIEVAWDITIVRGWVEVKQTTGGFAHGNTCDASYESITACFRVDVASDRRAILIGAFVSSNDVAGTRNTASNIANTSDPVEAKSSLTLNGIANDSSSFIAESVLCASQITFDSNLRWSFDNKNFQLFTHSTSLTAMNPVGGHSSQINSKMQA